MQVFIPHETLICSVSVLDNKRLGKQRVECLQILRAIEIPGYGYKNHPVNNMWREHTDALKHYANLCILEWIYRGFKNTMQLYELPAEIEIPIFRPEVYQSHRSNLLRKLPEHYGNYFEPDLTPDLPYLWEPPISSERSTISW
jgi:hypothetical protein